MFSFKEWLVWDEVLRETKDSILREAFVERSLVAFFEFVTRALASKPIAENSEQESDEDDSDWTMGTALKIQELARKVRWSAMIDRLEAVEQIGKMLEDDWKPFMRERRDEVVKEYQRQKESGFHGSDEEIRKAVGQKMGLTTYEVGRIVNDAQNEWSVIKEEDGKEEDEWKIPGFDEEEESDDEEGSEDKAQAPIPESNLESIISRAEPLLVKLGYLKEGQLEVGEQKDKIKALDKALRSAAAETGNQPEENETTRALMSNEGERVKARRDLMTALHDAYKKNALSSWRQSSVSMGGLGKDSTGIKGGRRGSQQFQGEEDILNTGIEGVVNSLTRRRPNQDGVAPPWDDLKVLSGASIGEIMGSIATRFRPQNISRDAIRDQKKAGGLSGSSTDTVQNLSGGAMQDDGTRGSIDPSDTRSSDSLTNAVRSTATQEIMEAFKKAMAELKDMDPLWAMLVCLRYELGCSNDGSMPPLGAQRLLAMASGSGSIGLTQTPENFFKRMATVGMPSQGAADDMLAQKVQENNYWNLLKDRKSVRKGGLRRMAPTIRSKEEAKTKEELDDWKKFVHTVRDAAGEGESWLWRRVNELMAQSGAQAAGQVDHRSWDITRFLRRNFRGATMQVSNPAPTEQSIKISFPASTGNAPKSYDILVTDNKYISIVQEGFDDMEELEIPDLIRCPYCDGSSGKCSECDGDGLMVDPKAISKLEYELRQVFTRSKRNVGKKA
jgi:hypothetical protein